MNRFVLKTLKFELKNIIYFKETIKLSLSLLLVSEYISFISNNKLSSFYIALKMLIFTFYFIFYFIFTYFYLLIHIFFYLIILCHDAR